MIFSKTKHWQAFMYLYTFNKNNYLFIEISKTRFTYVKLEKKKKLCKNQIKILDVQ